MMKVFEDDLNQRADNLVSDISHQSTQQTWLIAGRWGSGKSSLLHALKPRLLHQGLIPIVVSPPPRDMDTGPAALLQISETLQVHGLLNSDLELLQDTAAPWSEKLSGIVSAIDRSRADVVLLCDEAGKWTVPPTADEAFSPYSNSHIEELVHAIHDRLRCRRVFTHPSGGKGDSARRYNLPGDTHPSWLLEARETWSDLAFPAHELHTRLGANLGVATPLEIRLLVALAAVTSVTDVVGYYLSQWPESQAIVRRLASKVAARHDYADLRTLWAQLALCREFIDQELLDWMGAESLGSEQRAVLHHGLLHRRENDYEMNHVLRYNELVASWLTRDSRIVAHRRLSDYYAAKIAGMKPRSSTCLGRELEAFHHASESTDPDAVQRFRPLFADQLNKLGRALSKEARNFTAAADVFRQAIRWDDRNHYAHHYLAYNIDWLATDPALAESEYRRAIQLNPEHPWWWSRWINFLITLGRAREAREEWARAVEALQLVAGEGPETVYQSLHLSVARLLIHRAQLDFADAVLHETPVLLRRNDRRFGALENLLAALREAERARSLFPLKVTFNERWTDKPHLDFPRKQDIVKWFPAQVDAVSGETIRLVMGKLADDGQRVEYAHVELPRSRFDAASLDEPSGELEPGRFLELAFYGVEETLSIRSHPDLPWQSPDLPPIDPEPRRYLRKAGIAP